MVQTWIATLAEKTGRSLEEWIALVKKSGPASEQARRDWLKTQHRFGTNSAWWLAARAGGKESQEDSPAAYLRAAESYVEAMFEGKKTALRPIYDRLLGRALSLGKDVKACPCRTMVPLYRNHVFAQINQYPARSRVCP